MSDVYSVLIVDDHEMLREGIRQALDAAPDFDVIGEAASAEAALGLLNRTAPDIAILDIRLPGRSGIELARTIRRRWPRVKILVLSGYDFDQYVRALTRIGIRGYVLKEAPQSELIEALRQIAAGEAVLPPRIASKVMRDISGKTPARIGVALTLREIDVLEHVCHGLKNSEIAERLDISPRTVETHVASISAKLGAHSRTEIVKIAVEAGLLP